MTDLRAEFAALVAEVAALEAIVADRVFSGPRPQSATLPCVELHVISDVRQHWLSGPNFVSVARIQVDCLAATVAEVSAMVDAILTPADNGGLDGYRSPPFIWVAQTDGSDRDDFLGDGTDEPLRRISLDFLVKYRTR